MLMNSLQKQKWYNITKIINEIFGLKNIMGIVDWGLWIRDWGFGPIPNPQSPIPNPQSPS